MSLHHILNKSHHTNFITSAVFFLSFKQNPYPSDHAHFYLTYFMLHFNWLSADAIYRVAQQTGWPKENFTFQYIMKMQLFKIKWFFIKCSDNSNDQSLWCSFLCNY